MVTARDREILMHDIRAQSGLGGGMEGGYMLDGTFGGVMPRRRRAVRGRGMMARGMIAGAAPAYIHDPNYITKEKIAAEKAAKGRLARGELAKYKKMNREIAKEYKKAKIIKEFGYLPENCLAWMLSHEKPRKALTADKREAQLERLARGRATRAANKAAREAARMQVAAGYYY